MTMLWLLFWAMQFFYAFFSFMECRVEMYNLESGYHHTEHLNVGKDNICIVCLIHHCSETRDIYSLSNYFLPYEHSREIIKKTRIPVLLFLSIAQSALVKGLQSYSILLYFPWEYPNRFLEHTLFGNASLLPVLLKYKFPVLLSCRVQTGCWTVELEQKWGVLFLRDEEPKKSTCSKAGTKNFAN